jgi:hypothetical protein
VGVDSDLIFFAIKFQYSSSSSNLLMSVIKTLDASENNEEREREKLKIEKEFKKSDKKLQELVGKHDSELTKVSRWIGKVSQLTATLSRRCNSSQKYHLRSTSLGIKSTQFERIFRLVNTYFDAGGMS